MVLSAQVTPYVNSGNPKFPFPQFLPYDNGQEKLGNLGTKNATGFTHADMEELMKGAWQIVCNNTSEYPNAEAGGVQYLYPNPNTPNHCACVEGDGYYLLGAALMGDKTYFDGYFMWAHDRGFNGVKRFLDGVENPYSGAARGLSTAGKGYTYPLEVRGGAVTGDNSAMDGDEDLALALLIAYKQWGENSGIILNNNGWGGKEINYKEEALNYIKAMSDTSYYALSGNVPKYLSGDIGLDGYIKDGDFGQELTDWASGGYLGIDRQVGTGSLYVDYLGPAWYKSFWLFLEEENEKPFCINQFKRAEASSDWLMGLQYSKNEKNIPIMGQVVSGAGNDFIFSLDGRFAEDFRASWRTVMNYVWYGNPDYTWNPETHQIDETPNQFEYDVALRFSQFLKNNQDAPWNNGCKNTGDLAAQGLHFKGTYTLRDKISMDGDVTGAFPLNWIFGAGAASGIISKDIDLMGEMFRNAEIAWDGGSVEDSTSYYFHEWFRLAAMLTLSGNFHTPSKMVPKPNLKVYHKVDKTVAFTNDEVTFTVSYRNYGSVNADDSKVTFGIPEGFEFVRADKGGVVNGDSVSWNIGNVPGFQTGGLAATIDSLKVTLKIGPEASGRYCTTARISCTNGFGAISNEYPNNVTAVMERNCVDVIKRALKILKTADREEYNPGQDVKFKLVFENSSDAGWINGGRSGVRFAFAQGVFETPEADDENEFKYRIYNDAVEPYIDYGNYRVSYFLNDPSFDCYVGDGSCAVGWDLQNTIVQGSQVGGAVISHENIVPGSNVDGKWNQRMMLQFSPQLGTITQHLQQYSG